MEGYLRSDGRKGIRNVLAVAYLVECAHHVAAEIAAAFRDRDVHLIGFPGCYPNAYADRVMRQICTHPSVGAVLLVSLGRRLLDSRETAWFAATLYACWPVALRIGGSESMFPLAAGYMTRGINGSQGPKTNMTKRIHGVTFAVFDACTCVCSSKCP